LGGDFEAFAEVLAGEEEVQRGWGDDHLYRAVLIRHLALWSGSMFIWAC
jgi:hypothetical protein